MSAANVRLRLDAEKIPATFAVEDDHVVVTAAREFVIRDGETLTVDSGS